MATALRKILSGIRWLWDLLLDDSDGPWNYAGCCGCGKNLVNVALIASDNGQPVPGETYCWGCFRGSVILPTLDHVELPRALDMVPNREADEIISAAIADRQAA